MKKLIYFIFVLFFNTSFAQVGIGTVDPQQDLHVAGTTSTIRIESQNSINEPLLNDGAELAPIFVTPDGDLTVYPQGYNGGNLGDSEPLNFLISFENFIPNGPYGDGTVVENSELITDSTPHQLVSVPFSSPQTALIEVRYVLTLDLSDEFLPQPAASAFNDISARTIHTYFYIDLNNDGLDATELSKVYGLHGEAYSSYSQGSVGYAFIHGVGYGGIPAGNHALVFFGETKDGANRKTYVGFGGSSDNLKIRIYN